MMSWSLVSLIIIADLALISGALLYLLHLPGYDRTMYMEGIGVFEQRRIKMEVFTKFLGLVAIILGGALGLSLMIGIFIADKDTMNVVDISDSARIIEMQNGTSFVVTTKECVWVINNDTINEIAINLRVIARELDNYREPQLKVKSVDNMLGSSYIRNRLVLVLQNPAETYSVADPVLDLRAE